MNCQYYMAQSNFLHNRTLDYKSPVVLEVKLKKKEEIKFLKQGIKTLPLNSTEISHRVRTKGAVNGSCGCKNIVGFRGSPAIQTNQEEL